MAVGDIKSSQLPTPVANSPKDLLPLDLWSNHIFPFVGDHQYRFVGGVCQLFQQGYTSQYPEKLTTYDASISSYKLALICFNEVPNSEIPRLTSLCYYCSDWYKTLCNDAMHKKDLDLLKWARSIGCSWNES